MTWPPGPPVDFGPLVLITDVDKAVVNTLKTWLPQYLMHVELDREMQAGNARFLALPARWRYVLDGEQFLDEDLPLVVVTSSSLTVNEDMGGRLAGQFEVAVSAVLRGRTPEESRDNAASYEGAIRMCLLQQGSLDGFAEGTYLVNSATAPLEDEDADAGRWLAAATLTFAVHVSDVVDRRSGPSFPDPVFGATPDPADNPDLAYEANMPSAQDVTIAVDAFTEE